MTRAVALLSLAILTGINPGAQSTAPAEFSPERLARIDRVLQQHVDEGRIAGAVALVRRDGKPVYERAVGWSDKEAGRRMANDTVFRIASQTKAIQIGSLYSATGLGFGLGFETTDRFGARGMESVGAFGWGGAYGTQSRVDPQARLVMVLMIQLMPNRTDIGSTFPTLVYQALMDAPANRLAPTRH